MTTIGFIGLGTMGRHMARNLLKAGFRLRFFARRAEVVAEFKALGAEQMASPADCMRAAEATITIVTADESLKEVVLGPGGIAEGATDGKLFIDMSTVGPETERTLAKKLGERGTAMIDAPVSGGPWGAEAGTLTIMAGGAEKDVARARPIFDAVGKRLFHVGPLGAGQTVKIVNQMVAGGIMALTAEGFVLAKAAGANLEALADVMAVSSGNSTMLEARGKKCLLSGKYDPYFMTDLMRKDMALAAEMAERLGVVMPVAETALDQYDAAIEAGHGREDFAAVVKICEKASGQQLV